MSTQKLVNVYNNIHNSKKIIWKQPKCPSTEEKINKIGCPIPWNMMHPHINIKE